MKSIDNDKLHIMIRKFVGYGEPIEEDGEGSNKPDWPFFSGLAQQRSIDDWQMKEAAERFHKYRNTQLPRILKEAGLTEMAEDIGYYLESMKAQGEEGIKVKKEQESALSQVFRAAYRNEDTTDVVALAIEVGVTQAQIDKKIEAAEKSFQEAEIRRLKAITVDVVEVEDVWTNRWGKTIKTPRIGLVYSFNRDLNNALKGALPFPAIKFDGAKKMWTLKNDGASLATALKIVQEQGMVASDNFLALINNTTQDEEDKPPEDKSVTAYLEKGSTVVLKWPFLADPEQRNALLYQIKNTDGRKFRPDDKTWAISIAQVGDLTDRLTTFINQEQTGEGKDTAQQIIDAMNAIPEVETYMESRAKRIAISGASELSEDDVLTDIRERLAGVLPDGLDLYPFQYVGVRFAELAGGRALIGDDMGLGKTVTAIAYSILHGEQWPVLVVCPANVRYNWVKEFEKWIPDVKIEAIKTGKQILTKDLDVAVITYGLMNKKMEELKEYGFNIVITDESHYLKNKKTQRTKATLEVAEQSEAILCLSGTAITNRPMEFFTTLNLLRPAEFSNGFVFGKKYCAGVEQYIGRGRYAWNFDGASNTEELHNRVRDFCIRRLKKEVLDELPDKIRTIHSVEPTPADRRRYQDVHDSWMVEYSEHQSRGSTPKGFVLNMLTDLRHECGKLKINATVEWMQEYWTQNPKSPLVVFVHHRDVMSGLLNALKVAKKKGDIPKNINGATISGDTSADKRGEIVEQFQNGSLKLIIASTIAAKEGLTLTAADTVVFVEREWVPGWEEQAEDRVNRIGQESDTVWATYISVKGTIDEKFDAVIEAKRRVVKAVLDGGDMGEREGIAKALIKSMVEAGDLPESFLE